MSNFVVTCSQKFPSIYCLIIFCQVDNRVEDHIAVLLLIIKQENAVKSDAIPFQVGVPNMVIVISTIVAFCNK